MCSPCVHCRQLQQTSGDVVAVEGVVMKRTPNSLVLRTPCAGEKKVAGGPGCQPLDDAEALRAWAAPPKRKSASGNNRGQAEMPASPLTRKTNCHSRNSPRRWDSGER